MAEFFTEVDDDLRQARAMDAARRWWPIVTGVLLAALVAALAVWGWRAFQRGQEARASVAYSGALSLLAQGKLDEADRGFAESIKAGASGYRALSLMQQGGIRLLRHQNVQAADLLDRAAKATSSPLIADAASLEAALALLDTAPLPQSQARLEPLSRPGRPYRDMAREALALAKLAAGRTAEAKSDLSTLSIQPDVSEGARTRARAAVAMIDAGAASTLPAAVKAELALPPAPVGLPPAALAARSEQP